MTKNKNKVPLILKVNFLLNNYLTFMIINQNINLKKEEVI